MKRLPLILWCALAGGCGGSGDGSGEGDTSSLSAEVAPDAGGDVESDAVDDVNNACGEESEGVPCDDGNACTTGDRCVSGVCVGADSVVCEDEGACRVGVCDPELGCRTVALDGGEACGSPCVPGVCQAGECMVEPGREVVCPAPTNPCALALLCEPSTGLCTKELLRDAGAECDSDSNACSLERCDGAGACVATGETETCADEAALDPCWTQVCEPTKGCRRGVLLTGLSCNDNNPCTVQDQCIETVSGAGACVGEPVEVDDGNPCTDDYCEGGEVRHSPLSGLSCVPEAECEVAGMCAGGSCAPVRACDCPRDPGCRQPVCDPPCANGSCVADGVCDCGDSGYSGPTCSTPVCNPPCANGACVGPDMCDCGATGYSGPTCSTPVCDPPCANGSCVAPDTCDCGTTGYSGPTCSTPVCDPPCANGSCVAPDTCDCGTTGYSGPTCSMPVCDPPCANGSCVAPDTCDCGTTGFSGPTCSTPVCDPPCANGTCTAPDTCDCGTTGYSGPTCSTPVCDPPCANGACVAPDTCDCGTTGYSGPTCSTPVCDPPCANGSCVAPDMCDCGTTGYSGPTCSTPVCDPPCANGSCVAPDTCDCGTTGYSGPTCSTPVCDPPCANGSCVAPDTCDCGTTGYSGPTCATPVCDPPCANGSCVAPDTCDCGTTGYSGPTCATPVCDPPCANGTCTAPDTCDCGTTGYSGPTCATPVCDPPCANGTCTAPDTCDCGTTGYSGPTCATPVCDPPCANGSCVAPDTCDCGTTGFSGPTCATPVCDPPCANGTCTAPDTCDCGTTGYSGPTCSTPVCDPPCANGSCVAPDMCDCGTTGYSGPTCSTPVCDPPCANGSCVAPDTCDCGTTGYSGPTCATPVCDPPCANGTCTAPDTCDCGTTGFSGPTCATPVCDPPCANGSCVAPDQCLCDEGYAGDTCSTPLCDPACVNGACIAPDLCLCDDGYEDDTCSTPVCDPGCQNGVCIAPDLCLCDDGYDGDFCSDPICDPDCVFGECVAPDLCECDPGFVGPICDAPETVAWIRTFGSAAEDYGGMSRMLAVSHTGTFLAVGGTTSTDSDGDGYLIEVDDDGTLLTTRTFGGTASDSFSAITPFGTGYTACGGSRSWGGSRNKGYCVTLGVDLSQATTNTYGGNDLTNLFDVTASSDHFISAGNTTDTDAWLDFVIRKHNAAGAEVWKRYFGRSQDDTAYNVLAMSDGGFLLTGFTGGWAPCQQYYAIKTNAEGNKVWDRTYGTCMNGAQGNWHQMRQAIETADGGFVATGSILQSGQRSVFLQRFAANGDPVWLQTFGGTSTEYGSGVVATADGGFAVVGWTRSFGAGGDDVYLIKTDGDGVAQWQRTFGGPADEQGAAILALPDGGFLLGGTTRSWGAGGADLLLIRTDALGQAPDYIQCTPVCQNGGVCVSTNTCDCTGTGFFGQSCQFDEDEYTTAWDKFTEPQVVSMNAQVTVGTISWKRLTHAALYRVTRYSGANYGRVLETETTGRTFAAAVNQAYRIEALDAGGATLDFVNVAVSNLYPSNWTTGTFVDDFNDDVIGPNYLNNKPHQVVEANGYIQMTMTATDDYPGFYLPYDTQGRRYLRLTAKLFQYRANSQYTGGLSYNAVENSWKHLSFGSPWEDYRSWRGGQLRGIRYRSNPPTDAFEQIVSLDNVSRFGSWFDYELVVDTVNGQVSGRLGDQTFPTLFPVTTQFRPTGRVLIYFSQYGWFTGHYLRVDDLRVEAYD